MLAQVQLPETLIEAPEPMEWVNAIEQLIEILPWAPWLVGLTAIGLFIYFPVSKFVRSWRCSQK